MSRVAAGDTGDEVNSFGKIYRKLRLARTIKAPSFNLLFWYDDNRGVRLYIGGCDTLRGGRWPCMTEVRREIW